MEQYLIDLFNFQVLAIIPQPLLDHDQLPHLDNVTRQQLEILKGHLQVFCEHSNQ